MIAQWWSAWHAHASCLVHVCVCVQVGGAVWTALSNMTTNFTGSRFVVCNCLSLSLSLTHTHTHTLALYVVAGPDVHLVMTPPGLSRYVCVCVCTLCVCVCVCVCTEQHCLCVWRCSILPEHHRSGAAQLCTRTEQHRSAGECHTVYLHSLKCFVVCSKEGTQRCSEQGNRALLVSAASHTAPLASTCACAGNMCARHEGVRASAIDFVCVCMYVCVLTGWWWSLH